MITGRLASGQAVRIEVDGARIAAVEPTDQAAQRWILPGLVDLQVNGYAGLDVNVDGLSTSMIHELVRSLWDRGVTGVCPTLVTAPEEKIIAALGVIAEACAEDPLTAHCVLGVHVEGPYLSADDGPRGAHDRAHLRAPDLAEFDRWRQAAGDVLRIVTIAPETAGALEYIDAVAGQGVLVAVGHTAASPEQIRAAAGAGARLSTHLGNGAHAMLPRHPNHIWAQLAEPRLTASFIADGHHLPADTFTAMVAAKGADRSILVSDTVALAGRAPGQYETPVGGRVTLHPDGRLTLTGSELLAGSARSLAECLTWAVSTAGLDLGAAARMATANPAALLGAADRGRVEPGAWADLTVLSTDLQVLATVVRGQVAYGTVA